MKYIKHNPQPTKKHTTNALAFTLIELTVVMLLISTLAGAALMQYSKFIIKQRCGRIRLALSQIHSCAQNYRIKNGCWPDSDYNNLTDIVTLLGNYGCKEVSFLGSTAVTFKYSQTPASPCPVNPKAEAVETATSALLCEIIIDSVVDDDNPYCTTEGLCDSGVEDESPPCTTAGCP